MRFTDGLSLIGVMLVVVSLFIAARHGPTKPIFEAMSRPASEPVAVAPVSPSASPQIEPLSPGLGETSTSAAGTSAVRCEAIDDAASWVLVLRRH